MPGKLKGDQQPSQERAVLLFKRRFIRRLEQLAQRRVDYVYALERGTGGRWHIHALLNGTESLTCEHVGAAWDAGRADVQVYDPRRRAARYVVKDAGDGKTHWDFRLKQNEAGRCGP